MVYYFAYGSNLDYTRMFERCESAEVVGRATLDGYKLCFMENNSRRIVANIVKDEESYVDGVVYSITEEDMFELDCYEGHPFVYKRKEIEMQVRGNNIKVVTYIMPKKCKIQNGRYSYEFKRGYGVPKGDYFSHIQNGYTMFNLPQHKLMKAYRSSRDLAKKNLK